MAEIPGARKELERAARALRAQLLDLADRLEPGPRPDLAMPAEPHIVDWQEPLRYGYSATLSVPVSVQPSAAGAAARGAELLASWGWDVTVEATPADRLLPAGTLVTAHRDGYRLQVRAHDGSSAFGISGSTPGIALHPAVPIVRPDPVATAETLPPGHLLCYECDGLGWCPSCLGYGYVLDPARKRCGFCRASRACPICTGDGHLAISTLNEWARGQYPELDDGSPER